MGKINLWADAYIEERLRKFEAAQKFSSTGGIHRAKNLSAKQRSKIASEAAKTRWENLQEEGNLDPHFEG